MSLFSFVHASNVRQGTVAQNLAELLKLILIATFIGFGVTRISQAAGTVATPFSTPAFAMSLVWVSFSYAGWNATIYLAGEVENPDRNLPRSLLTGTLEVNIIYLALNAVFVLSAPPSVTAGRLEIGRLVADHLGGPKWATGATLLIAMALLTSVSSLIMTGPRVYARMAADGYLPRRLAFHEGPPRAPILFQFAIALLMLWTASYQGLLSFIGFTLNLCTAATVAGLIRERRRVGSGLHVPGWPWLPCQFVSAVLGMTLLSNSRSPLPSLAGYGILATGWVTWRATHRWNDNAP